MPRLSRLFYHRRAPALLTLLLPAQLAVPCLRTLLFCPTADAFLLCILLYPVLSNCDSHSSGNSPCFWFSGSECRKNIVTFLGKLRDKDCLTVARNCDSGFNNLQKNNSALETGICGCRFSKKWHGWVKPPHHPLPGGAAAEKVPQVCSSGPAPSGYREPSCGGTCIWGIASTTGPAETPEEN